MRLPRGFSFSWKRAIGLSQLKAKIARKTGIAFTRATYERRLGKAILSSSGCIGRVLLVLIIAGLCFATAAVFAMLGQRAAITQSAIPLPVFDAPSTTLPTPEIIATPQDTLIIEPAERQNPNVVSRAEHLPVSDGPSLPVVRPTSAMRTWTSNDGKYTVEAKFMGAINNEVHLEKSDESVIKVPKDRLSQQDLNWIDIEVRKTLSEGYKNILKSTVKKQKPKEHLNSHAMQGNGFSYSIQPQVSHFSNHSSASGTVYVKGYYRKDGTYVHPHTRSAPHR